MSIEPYNNRTAVLLLQRAARKLSHEASVIEGIALQMDGGLIEGNQLTLLRRFYCTLRIALTQQETRGVIATVHASIEAQLQALRGETLGFPGPDLGTPPGEPTPLPKRTDGDAGPLPAEGQKGDHATSPAPPPPPETHHGNE